MSNHLVQIEAASSNSSGSTSFPCADASAASEQA
jgi:hypothetical protein